MKKLLSFALSAVLVSGVVLTACNKDDNQPQLNQDMLLSGQSSATCVISGGYKGHYRSTNIQSSFTRQSGQLHIVSKTVNTVSNEQVMEELTIVVPDSITVGIHSLNDFVGEQTSFVSYKKGVFGVSSDDWYNDNNGTLPLTITVKQYDSEKFVGTFHGEMPSLTGKPKIVVSGEFTGKF
jgi:hypothetical protein